MGNYKKPTNPKMPSSTQKVCIKRSGKMGGKLLLLLYGIRPPEGIPLLYGIGFMDEIVVRTWNAVVAAETLRIVVDKLVHIRRQVIDIGEHFGRLVLLGLLLLGPLDAEQLGQDLDEEALHPRCHAMRDRGSKEEV